MVLGAVVPLAFTDDLDLLRALFESICPRQDGMPEEEMREVLKIVGRAVRPDEPDLTTRVTSWVERNRQQLVRIYRIRAKAHLLNEEYLFTPVALALLERLADQPFLIAEEWARQRYEPWLEAVAIVWGIVVYP